MIRGLGLAAMCLALALASPAAAQTRAGTAEFSGFLGWAWFDNDQLSDDLTFGVRGGWRFTDNWQVEAYYDRTETDTHLDIGGTFFDVSVVGATYGLDVLFNVPLNPQSDVYALAGIGQGASDFDGLDFFEIGGGFRYYFNPQWALRGDLRAQTYDNDGDFGFDNLDLKGTIGVSFILVP